MTTINSFLQSKKPREFSYGIYMVIAAYALSFLLLVIGSDTFYNITSKADGMSMQSDETKQITLPGTEDTIEEYHQVEYGLDYRQMYLEKYQQGYQEVYHKSISAVSDNTNWLLGYAMTDQEYDSLLGNMNQNKVFSDIEADSISSFSTSKLAEETSSNHVNITKDEIKMLERIVEAEATGEDIIGKVLVANVVFNRTVDEKFPDTIKEVIFQKVGNDYQFSPIADKRYWNVKVTEETKEAVQKALDGEDHSQGALFFMARRLARKSSTKWFDNNLTWLFKHGAHEFFR